MSGEAKKGAFELKRFWITCAISNIPQRYLKMGKPDQTSKGHVISFPSKMNDFFNTVKRFVIIERQRQ